MARRRYIDIITHCFSPEHLPFYADCLRIQLQGFVNCHSGIRTRAWVCHLPESLDPRTFSVVRQFSGTGKSKIPRKLAIHSVELPEREMFRRAIGRDRICRQIAQDSLGIWFTDVDTLGLSGCLESILGHFTRRGENPAFYPLTYQICRDHATGDQLIAKWAKIGPPVNPDSSLFITENPLRAIGGQMFVRGDQLERGYCYSRHRRHVNWQRFRSFTCDVAYRRFLIDFGVNFVKMPIDGLYRLRHTVAGYKDEVWEGKEQSGTIDI